MRSVIALAAIGALVASLTPAGADPLAQRDTVKIVQSSPKRYLASEPGKTEQLTWLFGPYTIPPGQDSNRITADIQLPAGFVRAVSPELIAASGEVPTEQEAHIHHAHWFRVTDDPDELYYLDGVEDASSALDFVPQQVWDSLPENFGLSWVFGTGEEKTQGGFPLREALEDFNNDGIPDRRYGMEIDALERQVLIYMIHNKTSAPLEVFVALDVEFMHGTRAELGAIGIDMRELKGQLFGRTADALRTRPTLIGSPGGRGWVAELSGTAIVSGGHSHPGAYGVFLTNQGPGGACTFDADGDGFPGITILASRKIDHVPGTWPYSEDFQMGVTKYGWRAPIREGDVLTQYGVYDVDNETTMPSGNGPMASEYALPGNYAALGGPSAAQLAGADTVDGGTHQHFEAMNHVGIYIDPLQSPEPYAAAPANTCPADFAAKAAPTLLGADTPAVQQRLRPDMIGAPYYAVGVNEGMQNHTWPALDPTCGNFAFAYRPVCDDLGNYNTSQPGIETNVVTIAGFQYLPGNKNDLPNIDLDPNSNEPSPFTPPMVRQGTTLTIINADAAANVRHTLTTCAAPCRGAYVSNFPQPDGLIDTGKLGNIDPIDGGLTPCANGLDACDDTLPFYQLDTTDMSGLYTYYCRIHPFMRGAFRVVA